MRDVIIIGGGPAGVTAAIYCARAGLNVLLLERMFIGGQIANAHLLENYPGIQSISGPDFAVQLNEQAVNLGVEIVYDDVLSVSLKDEIKTVATSSNNYQAKTVVLCMGAQHRKLGLQDEERLTGKGVSYCATCDGNFFRGKNVAVIGGGDTAIQDAIYLSGLAGQVNVIHRRDELRAQQYLKEKLSRIQNINIIWDSVIEKLNGQDRLESVVVRNVKTNTAAELNFDGVFVSVGQRPDTDMLKGQISLKDGYIVCDADMKTSLPGVFAAGDVCEKILRQVSTAIGDGAVAAHSVQNYLY